LTGKQIDDQMQPGPLVCLSRRRAVVEVTDPLPPYTDIMLRLEVEVGEEESPKMYAKVMYHLDDSGKRYLIHFTSVPSGMQAQLHRLVNGIKIS